jgi:hypothetical protein
MYTTILDLPLSVYEREGLAVLLQYLARMLAVPNGRRAADRAGWTAQCPYDRATAAALVVTLAHQLGLPPPTPLGPDLPLPSLPAAYLPPAPAAVPAKRARGDLPSTADGGRPA